MKIQVVSDLHLEWHHDGGKTMIEEMRTDADVLILAGDIDSYNKIVYSLKAFAKNYKHVIYVLGNHEFYYSNIPAMKTKLKKLDKKVDNIHWLTYGTKIVIDDQRFLGDTLWFPIDPDMHKYVHLMSDFEVIKNLHKDVFRENELTTHSLRAEVDSNDIVVTHHMPSPNSISKEFAHSNLNRFFLSDCSDIIRACKPKIWIHAHTHGSFDYIQDETRIICNPFGYKDRAENWKFDAKLVIEV